MDIKLCPGVHCLFFRNKFLRFAVLGLGFTQLECVFHIYFSNTISD
jgi:hypothetical protein